MLPHRSQGMILLSIPSLGSGSRSGGSIGPGSSGVVPNAASICRVNSNEVEIHESGAFERGEEIINAYISWDGKIVLEQSQKQPPAQPKEKAVTYQTGQW